MVEGQPLVKRGTCPPLLQAAALVHSRSQGKAVRAS